MQNRKAVLLLTSIVLLISFINCYQIQIPDYELLRNQHILTVDFKFNYHADSLKQMVQDKETQMQKQGFEQKLYFEMFLYPYRIFSYFDQSNKKQYLFKKIPYEQFNLDRLSENISLLEPIIYAEFDVRDCLFSKSSSHLEQEIQNKTQQKDCLQQSHIYSLIPDLMTIVQEQHEQIQLQKINQQFFIIKNFANPNSKESNNDYLNIDLHKVNVHSFLYEARFVLMKYLFQEKSNQHKNLSNTVQNERKLFSTQKEFTDLSIQSQQKTQPDFNVKMKDIFNSELQLWQLLSKKNTAIFKNLFNFETSIDIAQSQKFDYTSTRDIFYLTLVSSTICPLSTHDKKFDLFSSSSNQIDAQPLIKDNFCTHVKFYKIPFIQFQVQDATEYYNKQDNINQVQRVSLGTTLKQRNSKIPRNQNIMVNLMTKDVNIEIIRSKSWKQYGYSHRPKQHQIITEANNVFYLQNSKVQIQATQLIIYKSQESNMILFNKSCSMKFKPYLITSQKINNQIFVVCLQGSLCKIINTKCQVIKQVLLQNALGVQWSYKVNYVSDNILSFISIFKRSDNLYKVINAPIDQTLIQALSLKTQEFYVYSNFTEVQSGLYKGSLSIIDSEIKFAQTSQNSEIMPIFRQVILPYKYNPLKIFQDKTYKSFYQFKQRYLDEILRFKIEQEFTKYYVPNFKYQYNPARMLNMKNHKDFQTFFSDCKYNEEKSQVYFRDQWNGCKIIIKTNALMLADPYQVKRTQEKKQIQNTDSQNLQENSNEEKQQQNQKITQQVPSMQVFEIMTKQNLQPSQNKMIICSAHKNSPAYSKCRVVEYEVTQNFLEKQRKAKFFFEGSRYFQIYIFNKNFATKQNDQSFLELLQKLALQSIAQKNKQTSDSSKGSQLKQFKIVYSKLAMKNQRRFYINLVDYQKQQMENLSNILLISLCILFPIFTICCCVVFFKSYFQSLLIYYGVMRFRQSYDYPLNKLALKMKMKQLQKYDYLKIHKNKRKHKKQDEFSSDMEIKFSAECCFCLQELKFNEEVIEVYCKHEFHSVCFIEWVKNEPNIKCPLCKRTFTRSSVSQYNSRSVSISTRTADNLQSYNQNQEEQINQQPGQMEMIQFEE